MRGYKAEVLRKFPKAVAKQWSHAWCIERDMSFSGKPLGSGHSESEAWKNAAICCFQGRAAVEKAKHEKA